ncbi:MAG: hypothetical protein U0175_29810 [Caldilineaceae bacterium]
MFNRGRLARTGDRKDHRSLIVGDDGLLLVVSWIISKIKDRHTDDGFYGLRRSF